MKLEDDTVDSVVKIADRLFNGRFGATSTSGIIVACAILQASEELSSQLADLTLTLSMLNSSLGRVIHRPLLE